MDLNFAPEEEEFRHQVRDWLNANVPANGLRGLDNHLDRDQNLLEKTKEWQRRVHDAGYLALSWPREYGGQAMDAVRQSIVNEEMVRARAPGLIGAMGIGMVGATLITWGNDDQKARYLPKILRAEEIWCQGYSEPGAGSDLASLRTRAEVVGDEFVVNGQKVWTSGAHYADMMFCLVRTDPEAPKHRGISYVLIDMHSPGITVRPLVQMTGARGFNEVFFDNVRVARKPCGQPQRRLDGRERNAFSRAEHAGVDDHYPGAVRPTEVACGNGYAQRQTPGQGPGLPTAPGRPRDSGRGDEVQHAPAAYRLGAWT